MVVRKKVIIQIQNMDLYKIKEDMNYLTNYLTDHSESTKIAMVGILSIIGSYFTPILPVLWGVGCLIVLDTFFGIWRSKKLDEEVTSRKMRKVIPKLIGYTLAVLAVFLLEKLVAGKEDMIWSRGAAFVVGIIELKSIDESFKAIFDLSFMDKIRHLFTDNEIKTIKKIEKVKKSGQDQ